MGLRTLAALLAILSALPLVAAVPGELRTIALSGRSAAGVSNATYQFIHGNAVVNDRGQVAFGGQLTGPGITAANNRGQWLGPSLTQQSLIARTGDQAVGLPAGIHIINGFPEPVALNNNGEMTFMAEIENAQPSRAIWTTAGGSLRLLAADRYPLPNTPGSPVVTSLVRAIDINDAGQSSFYTPMATGSSFWVDTPGQPLRRVVAVGDTLPGGTNLKASFLRSNFLADNGRIAFDGDVTLNPFITYGGAWTELGGSIQLIAREQGANAPGYPRTFLDVGITSMANNGMLVFGGTVDSSPARVWYVQSPDGTVRNAIATGVPIPGSPSTLFWTYAPTVNSSGHIAFEATSTATRLAS